MPKLQVVLFDFDYTLADSSTAVVECCNAALKGIGLLPAQPERIHRTIGLSLPDTLASLAGEEHRHRAEEFRLARALRRGDAGEDHSLLGNGPSTHFSL